MALIKKAKLESLYGPRVETTVLDEMPLREPVAQEFNFGELEELTNEQVAAREAELLAAKEAEVARAKEASLAQIQQELEAAKLQAEEIIINASKEADAMRAQLDKEVAELEQAKAQQQAVLEQAKLQIEEAAMNKVDSYVDQLMQILSSFHNYKAEVLSEAKDEIAGLAIAISKQILGQQAKLDQTLIVSQVTAAVTKLAVNSGLVQIEIHPDDLVHQADLELSLGKVVDASVRIHFQENPDVEPGSCIITTSGGRLDASFSSQLELIRVAFERYLGHKISEIQDLNDTWEANEMSADANSNKLNMAATEPSDADLETIGELDLADLEIDEDMDKLLQDVLNSDADVNDDASVKIDDDISLDKADADEELSFNDTLLDEETDDDEESDDDLEFEEYNEFAEDPELADDSNFDGSSMDDRFPEY